MALTVKHLNGDASFLLTFEPILPVPVPGLTPEPYRILLDPWITGPSKIFHSKISLTTHKEAACVSSLRELPEPDLVIISQHKSDHCNEMTLKQLPPTGTKTIILAEPGSARTIRNWKYFDKEKVRAIPKWEDPRITGRQSVVRLLVPPLVAGGEPGEVTVAYIPQRRDISGLHAAIGITYRPPPAYPSIVQPAVRRAMPRSATPVSTPPTTPRSHKSYAHLPTILSSSIMNHTTLDLSPPTPTSPGLSSLRSVRSSSSIPVSVSSYTTNLTTLTACTSIAPARSSTPLPPAHSLERPLSILFSPHGISYASLHSYTTSHLIAEAALPLTALLHCFDSVSNPWWLGGNILLGAPAGTETAGRLGARAWISAHDGDKDVKGIATGLLRTRKWRKEEVMGGLNASEVALNYTNAVPGRTLTQRPGLLRTESRMSDRMGRGGSTEVLSLGTGREVVLTSEGVLNMEDLCVEPFQMMDEAPNMETGGNVGPQHLDSGAFGKEESMPMVGRTAAGLHPLPPSPVVEEEEEPEPTNLRRLNSVVER